MGLAVGLHVGILILSVGLVVGLPLLSVSLVVGLVDGLPLFLTTSASLPSSLHAWRPRPLDT